MVSFMIIGTSSSCGKSFVTTALISALKQKGYSVAPFKAQNISLNSYVTKENAEIAYATYVQALSAGIEPDTNMNPVLIKPAYDKTQIIIDGKLHFTGNYQAYSEYLPRIKSSVEKAYNKLCQKYDVVVIEGAGSAAEINIETEDIANIFTASISEADTILVADIHPGGVFASLHGTLDLLHPALKERIKGFVINRYSGEKEVLLSGIDYLERKHGVKCLGVLPYAKEINIPDEDFYYLSAKQRKSVEDKVNIGIISMPFIANNTDFQCFMLEDNVNMFYISRPEDLLKADLVILPGSKNTQHDYQYLIEKYYRDFLSIYIERGGQLVGICGGYQMLGQSMIDPEMTEMHQEQMQTFGFLQHNTVFQKEKTIKQVDAICDEIAIKGFEIHHGISAPADCAFILEKDTDRVLGTMNSCGNVWGTYIHNIFDNEAFRKKIIDDIKEKKHISRSIHARVSSEFDSIAEMFCEYMDIDFFTRLLE